MPLRRAILKCQYSLWNHRPAALAHALCFRRFRIGSALRYKLGAVRIHCCFNTLAPLAADFISADYPYLLYARLRNAEWT